MADFSQIQLIALSNKTKLMISSLLNPPKVLPTKFGLPRDWRGLNHLSSIGAELLPLIAEDKDPTYRILSIIEAKSPEFTIENLQHILENLNRWDIIDETLQNFEEDADVYLKQLEQSKTSAPVLLPEIDKKILTIDDLYRSTQGLEKQYYDAFLIFADEDADFAAEIVGFLEDKHKLKLCLKDRDLVAGITFEHEAVMKLISERCNRLIVILSPNFIKTTANEFFLNYAQALEIDSKGRKVIPVIYKPCAIPSQLSYKSFIDYSRVKLPIVLFDFWGKLHESVVVNTSLRDTGAIRDTEPQQIDCRNAEVKTVYTPVTVCDNVIKQTNLQAAQENLPKNIISSSFKSHAKKSKYEKYVSKNNTKGKSLTSDKRSENLNDDNKRKEAEKSLMSWGNGFKKTKLKTVKCDKTDKGNKHYKTEKSGKSDINDISLDLPSPPSDEFLPSLDGLDSLSSTSMYRSSTMLRSFVKKMQSLVIKS